MSVIDEIKSYATDIFDEVVKFRRHCHMYPELSFNEFETAKYIKSILSENQITIDEGFGDNVVIGIIEGGLPGSVIGLRADTDALAIYEMNDVEYKSQNNGIMHACGHDVHIASLLGTAIILSRLKHKIKGQIILIFQPAEEIDPGGAKILIEKGLLEKYRIEKILGQHVLPGLSTGSFGFTEGKAMASTNEIYVKFTGKGGHAAIPAQRDDTVLALTNFVSRSYKLISKYQTEDAPVIVAFGKIKAEGAINIIPSLAIAEGTMRTFDENVRNQIKDEIRQLAQTCAEEFSCKSLVEIKEGYPHLFNDLDLTKAVRLFASDYIGYDSSVDSPIRMTGEDFAYFAREIPATYYRMGIYGNGKGDINLHNEYFDIDEESLRYSSGLMAYLALMI